MDVTPLHLGLATAGLIMLFGPKKLPGLKKKQPAVASHQMIGSPSQYAAGRAPSPLQLAAARRADAPQHQFAMVDFSDPTGSFRPAPLPHELPSYG